MARRNEVTDIISGVFMVLGMHVLAIVTGTIIAYLSIFIGGKLSSVISTILLYALLVIGLSQLVYVVPTILWARSQQKWELMKGIIIGAVFTALLNGGCWLLIGTQF